MTRIVATRTIQAPMDAVFKTVADIHRFSQAIPEIVRVEMLSDVKQGIGTRFRETRRMKGREVATELEVIEYVENERVRMVADDGHGTVWDTVFAVRPKNSLTELTLIMDAKSYKWLPKILYPLLIRPMVKKAIEQNMDSVKAFCEE